MMPQHSAIPLLLLLGSGAAAFRGVAPPGDRRRTSSSSSTRVATSSSSSLESPPGELESILDDGRGRINADLARSIYEWEVAHNAMAVGGGAFSTRDGLRLVDELAREMIAGSGSSDDDDDDDGRRSGASHGDLVQEGVMALLRALSTYEDHLSQRRGGAAPAFEEYARTSIRSSLLRHLSRSSRPVNLPPSLRETLRSADEAASQLRRSNGGREPTLAQVAAAAGVPPERLALYRRLRRGMASPRSDAFVSVEDGMEVYDPASAGVGEMGGPRALRDRNRREDDGADEDERRATSSSSSVAPLDSLSASRSTGPSDPDASDDERDLVHRNSMEDDWTSSPPGRSVSPLRDVLADSEEGNDPLRSAHHRLVAEGLEDFLCATLTTTELDVIRLRFGLVESKYGGRGWTANEIAARMGMGHDDVVTVAAGALDKLRRAAKKGGEEGEEDVDWFGDAFVEVSL